MLKSIATIVSEPNWFVVLKQWWLILAVSLLLFLAEYVGLLLPVRSLTEQAWQLLIVPVSRAGQRLWQPVLWFETQHSSAKEVAQLRTQYNQALVDLAELDRLQTENAALKQLLDGPSSVRSEAVILSAPIMAYGRPLIAAGTQQGVGIGMSVQVNQTLVGIIGEVSQNQATVDLLSQETQQTILAKTEKGVTGIIKGDGKRIVLTEVPIDSRILPGERVVTQGQAGIQPNTLIGVVAEVKVEPSASVQTATIIQLVSFYETSLVEVR